jgi:hypothetical protein
MKLGRPHREAFSFLFVTANISSWSSEGRIVDVAHKWGGEAVDAEIGRLIARRASQDRRPDPVEQDERWKLSVAAYNAARIEENRQAWREHHERQAAGLRAVLEQLIARHEEQAEKYRDQKIGEA